YDEKKFDPGKEWSGQCISVARIAVKDLDDPEGNARRWDGEKFNANYNAPGAPVASLQIPMEQGGVPASSSSAGVYWGPSVRLDDYLSCWAMLMGKATGPSWAGSSIYISFNNNK